MKQRQSSRSRRGRMKIIAVAYLLLLTYALLTPRPLWAFGKTGDAAEESVDMTFPGFSQHAAAYAILACLLLAAFGTSSRRAQLGCVLSAALHGSLMEGLQYFVPLRYCDLPDAVANLVGVGIGWLIAVVSWAVIRRRNSPSR